MEQNTMCHVVSVMGYGKSAYANTYLRSRRRQLASNNLTLRVDQRCYALLESASNIQHLTHNNQHSKCKTWISGTTLTPLACVTAGSTCVTSASHLLKRITVADKKIHSST